MTLIIDQLFQSTHPVWGATLSMWCYIRSRHPISIHAPRVGCDSFSSRQLRPFSSISIHAPRVGCDHLHTSPPCDRIYFNPRTPCGVRPSRAALTTSSESFQSTHPVWGATDVLATASPGEPIFQSTHPVWGATTERIARATSSCISIHAPRVGCDIFVMDDHWTPKSFQSTHPVWGATLRPADPVLPAVEFQSTHPVWGATRRQ